ncbi:hypothetical protein [Iningainema tapete]|uniref:Uncharacterized protein n=1 Tax=Iningainema tapete BLCC-T55 TaxID=2748662 RepID=A0A8J7BYF5_9CYAN|nr:hypothetical protein [Iningainema tapete]MBD2774033.1 hypothetical protein [Iningainema tapete BLCC-T55]
MKITGYLVFIFLGKHGGGAVLAIHQLLVTEETLWLRILGKDRRNPPKNKFLG